MAELLAADEGEIHFGPSTSQVRMCWPRPCGRCGTTATRSSSLGQDHEANQGAWRRLADTGIVVKEWAVDPETGLLDTADLDELITGRTRLLGHPRAEHRRHHQPGPSARRSRARGGRAHRGRRRVLCTARPPDVAAPNRDVYLYSTYKTYGPHVGLMYTRRSLLKQMTNQGHYFKDTTPEGWLTPAGPDHAAIGSVAGIADYYDTLVAHHGIEGTTRRDRVASLFAAFAAHEAEITAPLVKMLIAHDRARLVGAPTADHAVRAPTVAFHVPGTTSASIYDVNRGQGLLWPRQFLRASTRRFARSRHRRRRGACRRCITTPATTSPEPAPCSTTCCRRPYPPASSDQLGGIAVWLPRATSRPSSSCNSPVANRRRRPNFVTSPVAVSRPVAGRRMSTVIVAVERPFDA